MHRRSVALVSCLFFAFAGCKAKEAFDKATIAKDLEKKGTTDLMKEVAEDSYDPPADGKLTDAQVKMYLKVREREREIAQVARQQAEQHADKSKKAGEKSLSGMIEGFKTLGSVADMLTADIRAAKDLGFNSQEYLWVKGQVLAASSFAMAEKFTQSMSASMDKAYQDTKKAHDEATDETTKQMYAQMLAGYEQSKKETAAQQDQDPAAAYNRQLVAKYENELNAIASELAKWEQKPGQAEQWKQEMQKNQ
jgi:hypothetical protein